MSEQRTCPTCYSGLRRDALSVSMCSDPWHGEPTPPATPQHRHRVTDWIPTDGCDCDKCTSARKSATPQPETRPDVGVMLNGYAGQLRQLAQGLESGFSFESAGHLRKIIGETLRTLAFGMDCNAAKFDAAPPPDVERLQRRLEALAEKWTKEAGEIGFTSSDPILSTRSVGLLEQAATAMQSCADELRNELRALSPSTPGEPI